MAFLMLKNLQAATQGTVPAAPEGRRPKHDGAKELVMGMFHRKCQEVKIWVKQTEPYTCPQCRGSNLQTEEWRRLTDGWIESSKEIVG